MCALQKQYDFFRRNMSSLLEDYDGKYLVIPESLEVKAFDTISEAYKYGAKTYGLVNSYFRNVMIRPIRFRLSQT